MTELLTCIFNAISQIASSSLTNTSSCTAYQSNVNKLKKMREENEDEKCTKV